jgi:flagellar biosynthesis/type III secretory pathway M-ring protein FliF/YscJ
MKPPRKGWFIFWMLWISTFLVAEAIAIFDRDLGDTLSESIWFLQRSWWPLTVILALLFIFLIVHFLFDSRSRKRKEADEQPQQKSEENDLG